MCSSIMTSTRVCEPIDLDELHDMEKVEEEQKSSGAAKIPVDLNELEEQKKTLWIIQPTGMFLSPHV